MEQDIGGETRVPDKVEVPRTRPASTPRRRTGEEVANSITHGVGAGLALAGLSTLVTLAALRGNALHVVGCAVFGTSLVAMFASSTLYHAVTRSAAKNVLRALDHAAIYLVIAGTYTPFMLVSVRWELGWPLLLLVWAAAATGCVLARLGRRFEALRVSIYIGLGWVGIVAFGPLFDSLGMAGLSLVVAGGVVYTVGVFFYRSRRLPYSHAVWHVFVVLGSVLHFLAVLWYVVPRPGLG
jgi:hemolysin III